MQHQLLQLPQVGVLRNVSIQVLPFGKCSGLALNGRRRVCCMPPPARSATWRRCMA
ncbi:MULTISPECIES: hypothetical protein [Streptomyces]|uniref:hypothetical protein n=1 Tax=Streptomyces TaxID=1883 RepID=UPI0033BDAA90